MLLHIVLNSTESKNNTFFISVIVVFPKTDRILSSYNLTIVQIFLWKLVLDLYLIKKKYAADTTSVLVNVKHTLLSVDPFQYNWFPCTPNPPVPTRFFRSPHNTWLGFFSREKNNIILLLF